MRSLRCRPVRESTRRLGRTLVKAGALASAAVTANLAVNLTQAQRPTRPRTPVVERVSVLIPARNEAQRIAPLIASLVSQEGLDDVEFIVLDDGSTDDTADVVHAVAQGDPRVRVIIGPDEDPPAGWIGKPWACHRLAAVATGTALVFLDADVVLEPWAIAGSVRLLRDGGYQLIAPWPRQIAESPAERITQPVLNWAWMSLLPVGLAMRSPNPLWSAANGQFLVFDADAYRDVGGHTVVAGQVIEDITIMFNLKKHGYRGTPVIGAEIASCRMYTSAAEIYDGYTKNLWSVVPSRLSAIGVVGAAAIVYALPPIAAVAGRSPSTRRWGALGYTSATLGRAAIARRTGERVFPDALAHPLSIMAMVGFMGVSRVLRDHDRLRWKGRRVHP